MTDRLRHSGIDYAQGFHIGVPRPIVEIFRVTRSLGLGVRRRCPRQFNSNGRACILGT